MMRTKITRINLGFKLQDLWIGIFWKTDVSYDFNPPGAFLVTWIWICIIPCFPIHIRLIKEIYGEMIEDIPPTDAAQPVEITDEMIRAALATELEDGPISQDIGFGMMRVILQNAFRAHPEDAPGGPWEMRGGPSSWLVGKTGTNRRIVGLLESEAIAVRDALNQLKGD